MTPSQDSKSIQPTLLQSAWKLIHAMNHHEDMMLGYRNGGSSISEVTVSGDEQAQAKSDLFDACKREEQGKGIQPADLMAMASKMNRADGYLKAVNDLYDLLVFKGVERELKSEIWSTMMQKALQYPPKESEVVTEKPEFEG